MAEKLDGVQLMTLAEQGVFYANAQELMLRFLDAPNLGGIQRFAQEFIS